MTTQPIDVKRLERQMRLAALANGAASSEAEPVDPQTEQLERRRGVLEDIWQRSCPRRFQRASLADLDPGLRADLDGWLADRASNVILIGPVGTGKTHALWAVVRELHFSSVRWSGASVPDLVESLRPDREQTFNPDADVLLLDDIGAERSTDWTREQLTRIIDGAWNDARPILASSNLAPEKLADWLGERAWSRLAGGAVVRGVSGADRRFGKE